MIRLLIKFAQGMDRVIHGVNKNKKLALYNLPLSIQILSINMKFKQIQWMKFLKILTLKKLC